MANRGKPKINGEIKKKQQSSGKLIHYPYPLEWRTRSCITYISKEETKTLPICWTIGYLNKDGNTIFLFDMENILKREAACFWIYKTCWDTIKRDNTHNFRLWRQFCILTHFGSLWFKSYLSSFKIGIIWINIVRILHLHL